jgi:quaternary ammonium compound-resistance protein SugE
MHAPRLMLRSLIRRTARRRVHSAGKIIPETTMGWTYLLIAGIFEIIFALGLKYTEGFTRLMPSAITVGAGVASLLMLSQALKTVPVGTGYATWTGIGAVGATTLGMVLFDEPRHAARLICIGLIVVGIIGLRLTSIHQ